MHTFPAAFLFGTATSATQIEGGCENIDWLRFARQPGRVRGNDTPLVACDSWNRWRDDVRLQQELGLNAYRLSLEWGRIEPRPDEFDREVLSRYREQLAALREANIEPMVTLHHFSLPLWLSDDGGVLARAFPERFERFAVQATQALSELCTLWITFNEPSVLVAQGYLLGAWPPGENHPLHALLAHQRLLEAHNRAYRAIHDVTNKVQVGLAHHLRVIEAERPEKRRDQLAARLLRGVFNDPFADSVCRARTQDFFGINYYSRDLVRLSPRHPKDFFVPRSTAKGAELSDLGWEIYPEGLGRVLDQWAPRCNVPIYITENGIADRADTKRPRFLVRHLTEVSRAIARGVDVRGYFHWSLLDNFEWAEGYEPRFGLVEVDYKTQARKPRPSAQLYSRIARERALPDPGEGRN
jgi:beta-glucosidase